MRAIAREAPGAYVAVGALGTGHRPVILSLLPPSPRGPEPSGPPGASDPQSPRPVGSEGLSQELGRRAYFTMGLSGSPLASLVPWAQEDRLHLSLVFPRHSTHRGVSASASASSGLFSLPPLPPCLCSCPTAGLFAPHPVSPNCDLPVVPLGPVPSVPPFPCIS